VVGQGQIWAGRLEPIAGWLAGVVALIVLAATTGCDGLGASAPAPNVVLIVVDTLRADHLGAYGYDEAPTSPHLDALAERGVVFDRAIAASSLTAPAHASMMTSRYVRENSVGYLNGGTRLVDTETLASTFSAAGYATAAFVSNNILKSRIGLDHGFDLYDDDLPEAERNRPYVFERGARETTARAVEWLAGADERPFFLWVHYQDPHGPYTPPPELARRFVNPPSKDERALPILNRQNGLNGIPAYQALPGLSYLSQYRGLYAGEIRAFDDGLGVLLDAIRRSEGDRATVILLTADHGESFGERDYYLAHGHATTPDLVRVPLIVAAPGLEPGRSGALVHHVDVMPTLLDLAGVVIPEGTRGVPIGRLFREEEGFPARTVYSDVGNDVSAYRQDGFVRIFERGKEVNGSTGQWEAYGWAPDGSWTPMALDEAVRAPITHYLDTQTPTADASELDAADIERLRALGYVEPDS